jgi:hypothetical protein
MKPLTVSGPSIAQLAPQLILPRQDGTLFGSIGNSNGFFQIPSDFSEFINNGLY